MNKPLWERRFPTLLGLFLLVSTVVVGVIYTQRQQFFESHATPTSTPENVQVTNITANSFTVSFTTQESVSAQLLLNTDTTPLTVFDERDDIGGSVGSYYTHSFIITNIDPGKTYSYSLLVGAKTYQNGGVPFTAKTATVVQPTPSTMDPFEGSIVDANTNEVTDALVYITAPGMSPLSTLLKRSGTLLFPPSELVTEDLTGTFIPSSETLFTLTIFSHAGNATKTVLFGQQAQIGQITVGENQSASTTTPSDTPTIVVNSQFQTTGSSDVSLGVESILTPEEGSFSLDTKPLIRGTGKVGETVNLTIDAQPPVSFAVDSSGNWAYQPIADLPAGKRIVTISFLDNQTQVQNLTRSFEILASGLQVQQNATPSPTTITRQPSITPIVSATISAVPTVAPLPVTATVTPTILGIVLGVVVLSGGLLLFFVL